MKIIGCLAVCRDLVTIGDRGGLPWGKPLPADMRRFRNLTMGYPVIYGRKTLESIGGALPGRCNIILSRQSPRSLIQTPNDGGVPYLAVPSLGDALHEAVEYFERPPISILVKGGMSPSAFVLGGAQVFKRTWGILDEVYLTIVDHPGRGSVQLEDYPLLGPRDWEVAATSTHSADKHNAYQQEFIHYIRKDS